MAMAMAMAMAIPFYYNDNNIKAAKIIYHACSGIAL
jgi:hypothetical protein